MHTSSCEKPSLEVARVSTVPVEILKEGVALSFTQKYPDATVVNLTQNVSVDGINYISGMIIAHGSVGGLPEFAEIVQMCLKRWIRIHCEKNEVMVQGTLPGLPIGSISNQCFSY